MWMGKRKDLQAEVIIAQLEAAQQPIQPDDPISEAGRKVLQGEFIRILQHEAGARSGADPEDVHKMRVAIRQTRSAFRLLEDYFEPGVLRGYRRDLRRVMRALAAVRDLDVMMHDLGQFKLPEDEAQIRAMQGVIEALDQRRLVARQHLIATLDSKAYRRFIQSYLTFLTTPGLGARTFDHGLVVPFQVRHALPPMIYQHVAAVRAYDTVLEGADGPTLHALRIEFKRLRYGVALFAGVLGKEAESFINEIKKMQDLLGRMNDIEVARESLHDLMQDLDGDQNAAVRLYLEWLDSERETIHAKFPAAWQHFNTRTVQRKLAAAVTVL